MLEEFHIGLGKQQQQQATCSMQREGMGDSLTFPLKPSMPTQF
jgi:hypothetical protein